MTTDPIRSVSNPSAFHGSLLGSQLIPRLLSICHDAEFVADHAREFPELAVAPNRRCGSWYWDVSLLKEDGSGGDESDEEDLERKGLVDVGRRVRGAGEVYFKSTDGHINEYNMSPSRLNLDLLRRLVIHGGCLLIDSTRQGKSLPDALSKTVPIWCCVVNRAALQLNPERSDRGWDTELHLPAFLPPSEPGLIEKQLPRFVELLLSIDASHELLQKLEKPLRPLWSTRSAPITVCPWRSPSELDFIPVICVQPSHEKPFPCVWRGQGFTYVPGAGDDEENWSCEMSAAQFWEKRDEVLAGGEEAARKVAKEGGVKESELIMVREGERAMAVGPWGNAGFDKKIFTGSLGAEEVSERKSLLVLGLPSGKPRFPLERALDSCVDFAAAPEGSLLISGPHAASVAFAILVYQSSTKEDKESIGKVLAVLEGCGVRVPRWGLRAVRAWFFARHGEKRGANGRS